jgi:MoaA/NifB/PqqE/SkfB family radical SAM enzyme
MLRKLPTRAGWWLRKQLERFGGIFRRRLPGIKGKAATETGHKDLQGRFCRNPFRQLDLEPNGAAFACCSSWLPTTMGNIKTKSLEEMWNGHAMQKIRESIYDGSFRYCRHDRCPVIMDGRLQSLDEGEQHPVYGAAVRARKTKLDNPPIFLNLVNDRSCNLYCPSCRTERIIHKEGPEYEQAALLQQRLLAPYLEGGYEGEFELSITGSGDPFASRAYRELLYSLDGEKYPNMKIALQTNGVLLTPRNWERMKKLHGNVSTILISFDAGTEETYNITRRGGHWDTLLENCRRMGELRARGEVKYLRFDFVVQRENFREMKQFIELARELGADHAYFSKMLNWGTFSQEDYLQRCPWEEGNPFKDEFFDVLRDPVFDDPFVILGNLNDYRVQALDEVALA